MNIISTVKQAVTSKTARAVLKAQKHSPELLFGAGVVGVVSTAVLTARGTLKAQEVMDEHEEKMEKPKKALAIASTPGYNGKPYDLSDFKHDTRVTYAKTALDMLKVYSPAIVSGVVTVCLFGKSHQILTKRNAALTAAYTAVDKAFREYRERVSRMVGPDGQPVDHVLRHESEDVEITDEKGKVVGKKTRVNSDYEPSMYAKFFGRDNKNWVPSADHNMMFLRFVQNDANRILAERGHLLLNDVYDMLGIERTNPGMVIGWVYDHTGKNLEGDNYVDFGIFTDRADMERIYDFVTGREDEILLDFNVDGVIFDKI